MHAEKSCFPIAFHGSTTNVTNRKLLPLLAPRPPPTVSILLGTSHLAFPIAFQIKRVKSREYLYVGRIPLVSESLVILTVVVAVILLERFGRWDGMRMNWMASI